jgi:hypothetical protein
VRSSAPDAPIDTQLLTADDAGEGWVCCIAMAPGDAAPGAWSVARVDEPNADRVACALLSAGSRGLVCRGRCLATTSYALRKYGGVCFGAPEDWLAGREFQGATVTNATGGRLISAHVTVQGEGLIVAHDAHGRQVATDA